jgi:hypothetical protein
VALVFSAENEAGDAKFPPEFIERIRRLGYRQFMFMPKGGPLKVDSIARFDEVQSVAEHQLKPTGYALAPEVCDIAKSQASYFLTDLSGKDFGEWPNRNPSLVLTIAKDGPPVLSAPQLCTTLSNCLST